MLRAETFDAQDLYRLDGSLHDLWVDLEAVTQKQDELRIPVASRSTRAAVDAVFDFELVLRHVFSWSLEDPQQIAKYSVNHLRYDAATRIVTLEAEPDAVLSVEVQDFAAALR